MVYLVDAKLDSGIRSSPKSSILTVFDVEIKYLWSRIVIPTTNEESDTLLPELAVTQTVLTGATTLQTGGSLFLDTHFMICSPDDHLSAKSTASSLPIAVYSHVVLSLCASSARHHH